MAQVLCEGGSIEKKKPVAIIEMKWNEEVVLKWQNVTATLHFEKEGILVGKTEKEINLRT